eukprot:3081082-Rhodomonas_salina.9
MRCPYAVPGTDVADGLAQELRLDNNTLYELCPEIGQLYVPCSLNPRPQNRALRPQTLDPRTLNRYRKVPSLLNTAKSKSDGFELRMLQLANNQLKALPAEICQAMHFDTAVEPDEALARLQRNRRAAGGLRRPGASPAKSNRCCGQVLLIVRARRKWSGHVTNSGITSCSAAKTLSADVGV